MSLIFHCPACQSEINTDNLGKGDSTICHNCGTEILLTEDIQDAGEESTVPQHVSLASEEASEPEPGSLKTSRNESGLKVFTSPAGAGLVIICFFLPWVRFSCGRTPQNYSGADLGGIFWLVFIAALAIIGAFLLFRSQRQTKKSKPYIVTSSLVAISIMVYRYIEFISGGKEGIKPSDIGLSIQFGAVATVIGFIAALIGTSFLNSDTETTSMRSCGDCGAELRQGDQFCRSCGCRVA